MKICFKTIVSTMLMLILLIVYPQASTSNTNNGYYIVKKGDNLSKIAKKFDVTVDELIKWNKIKQPSKIFAGKLLIVDEDPDTYKVKETETNWVALNFSDVDIRDILEIVALEINKDILYVGAPIRMSIKADKVYKNQLLEMVLSTAGNITFVDSGNMVIVGPKDKISNDFKSKQLFTGIKLKYITAPEIVLKAKELSIDVTPITLEKAVDKVWVQGIPAEVSRFYDLVRTLDRKENFSDFNSEGKRPVFNKEVTLKYITNTVFNNILAQFKVPVTVIESESNPQLCYVSGPRSASNDFDTILKLVDVKGNTHNPKNGYQIGVSQYNLKYISPGDADQFIAASKLEVDTMIISYYPKAIFLFGPENYRKEALRLLSGIDVVSVQIKEPVDYSNSENGVQRLTERMNLICDLSGVSTSNFTISDNVAREDNDYYYILWFKGNQTELSKVRKAITQIDDPLGGGN